jgi:choline/glycine/proline betaine transport protein
VFWGFTEGAIAGVLLYAGGLEGFKSAAICMGLPFCAVLVVVCFALVKALRGEVRVPARPLEEPGTEADR